MFLVSEKFTCAYSYQTALKIVRLPVQNMNSSAVFLHLKELCHTILPHFRMLKYVFTSMETKK